MEENLQLIADSVGYLATAGRELIYDAEHFFDGWKNNPDYAAQTIRAAAQAGAKLVVLCDTNGGSMPEEIHELTQQAIEAIRKWEVPVGIHCHNDCGLAEANSLAAVDAGAVHVQGTINGFGERCGNANLLMAHGTEMQKTVFARNEFGGRFAGTMCLSEPQAGSSL